MAVKSIHRNNRRDVADWLSFMDNWYLKAARTASLATNLSTVTLNLSMPAAMRWFRNDFAGRFNGSKQPGSWWKDIPATELEGEEGSLGLRGCEIFDDTQLGTLEGAHFQLDVAKGMPYGSPVDSQEQCFTYCWRQPQCRQVVYAKHNRACYPAASASPRDKERAAGTNQGFATARCGVRSCSNDFEKWYEAKTGTQIDFQTKKAREMPYNFKVHSALVSEVEGTRSGSVLSRATTTTLPTWPPPTLPSHEDPWFLSDMPNSTNESAGYTGSHKDEMHILWNHTNLTRKASRIHVGSWQECKQLCRRHHSCKQAVFDMYDFRCELRNRRVGFDEHGMGGHETHFRSAQCAARTCMLFDGRKKYDAGLAYLRLNISENLTYGATVTWAKCLRGCETDYNCEQTVFNKGNGQCFPLSAAVAAEAGQASPEDKTWHSGWVSAYCFEVDVNPFVGI